MLQRFLFGFLLHETKIGKCYAVTPRKDGGIRGERYWILSYEDAKGTPVAGSIPARRMLQRGPVDAGREVG